MKYYTDPDESPIMIGQKFRNKEDVESYFSGDRIRCLICGQWLKAISGQHLKKHRVSVEQYKDMFGLPNGRGLVCGETHDRQRKALIKRIADGDPSLTVMTPDLMYKAQHAPKKKPPQYHIDAAINRYAPSGIEAIKNRATERADNINWDEFLNNVSRKGKAAWSLCREKGMPSQYDVYCKMQADHEFRQKYDDAIKQNKLKYAKISIIIELKSQGLSSRKIAQATGVSPTHVKRILREQSVSNLSQKSGGGK